MHEKGSHKGCKGCLRRLWVISVWPKPSGNYWSCEDIVGVVGDTLGVLAAVDASFAEVTEAPKSEVTTARP